MEGKKSIGAVFASGLLSTMVIIVSLALTVVLLVAIGSCGRLPGNRVVKEANLGVVENFFMNSSNAISEATSSILNMEKKYWISADARSAPEPDQDCFGQTEDPAELETIIQQAENLLDGQTLFFSPDVSVLEGTPVRYYLDDTILTITWKQAIDNTVYNFSEVKIADPSQFRRFLAGGEFGSGKLVLATEMANQVNAVVAASGDFYANRNAGVIVYNGKICRASGGADTCYVDANGDLHFSRNGELTKMDKAQQFVDENNILFSIAFGPILVENGEKVKIGSYPLGEINDNYARAALCQMGKLHYLLINANGEGGYDSYPSIRMFANRVYETGCTMAYALDGGQTAAMVMNGELINRVTFGYQRKISDIIYFGSALPGAED